MLLRRRFARARRGALVRLLLLDGHQALDLNAPVEFSEWTDERRIVEHAALGSILVDLDGRNEDAAHHQLAKFIAGLQPSQPLGDARGNLRIKRAAEFDAGLRINR